MGKYINTLLLPGENIIEEITATFEVEGTFGISYKFANLIATNKRLISFTEHPFLSWREVMIYDYNDITRIDIRQTLFSFNHDVSIVVKLVNKGNAQKFLRTIQLFAVYAPGIRNFQQNSSGQ